MKTWLNFVKGGWLERFLDDKRATYVWTKNLKDFRTNLCTWDYQWILTCWTHAGLAIHPRVNLVSNIGFGNTAIYTSNPNSPWANLPVKALSFPLEDSPFIIRDTYADRHLQNTMFDPSKINKASMLVDKLHISILNRFMLLDAKK
jgi:hypothetical protein